MSAKQPEPIQFELDFGENDVECVCAYPRAYDEHVVAFAMARATALVLQRQAFMAMSHQQPATVFSLHDRLARKQQAYDEMLYEAILARIKHLSF